MSEINLTTLDDSLIKMTVKELENICKGKSITYYSGKRHLTKDEMITKIKMVLTTPDVLTIKSPDDVKESEEVTNPVFEQVVDENDEVSIVEEKVEEEKWVNAPKDEFIEEAEPGTLIAFYDNKGKPRTAALVNRSSNRRLVKLVTEFGWEFIVPYENVLWIKKGNRWPKGIYNLLKGYKNGKEN